MKSNIKKILSIALAVPLMMFAVVGVAGSVGAREAPTRPGQSDPANPAAVTNAECMRLSGRWVAVCSGCTAGDATTFNAVTGTCNEDGDVQNNAPALVGTIINIMLYIIGILCVIMIIWGGITYTTSRGKDDKVKSAKNTILYATIGLVVALIAWALVNWVFDLIG